MFHLLAALAFGFQAHGAEITIYEDHLALVQEHRTFDLQAGVQETKPYSVPSGLEDGSVQINALNGTVQTLEEDFNPGLSGENDILEKFVGQKIEFEEAGASSPPRILKGTLIQARGNSRIIESGGKVYLDPAGTFILPDPDNPWTFKPSLRWELKARKSGRYQFEIGYLTSGLSWSANYAAVLNQTADRLNLSVWAGIKNDSGVDFKNAKIKLITGSPNHPPASAWAHPLFQARSVSLATIQSPKETSFFEYHLYNLPSLMDLTSGAVRRVSLGQASGVPVKKIYVYDASDIAGDFTAYTRSSPDYGSNLQGEVEVVFKTRNSKSANLGFPLPPGRIRLYQKDSDGALEWVGEDLLPATNEGSKIKIRAGRAFDVTGRRTQVDFKPGKNKSEESFAIRLDNRGDSDVSILVVERLYRWSRWKIVSSSIPWAKKDARTIQFEVPVKKKSKSELHYTVRYFWR